MKKERKKSSHILSQRPMRVRYENRLNITGMTIIFYKIVPLKQLRFKMKLLTASA
jgi:hypothetical protein